MANRATAQKESLQSLRARCHGIAMFVVQAKASMYMCIMY